MNGDLQGSLNTGGANFSQTRNPQVIGGQTLGATTSNLQTGSGSLLNQNGLTISSVGSANFQSINVASAQTSTPTSTTNSALLPVGLGFLVVLIVITSLVALAVKNKKSVDNSQTS